MNKIQRIIYCSFAILLLLYLFLPNQPFPEPPDYFLQSYEPADVESSLRRGYYNDSKRQDVINYYRTKFDSFSFFGENFQIFSFNLNYPPEDSQNLIRDQTRSTYLEELVHPLRESFFINGFEPARDNDQIFINDHNYCQKTIVKKVETGLLERVVVGVTALISIYILIFCWNEFSRKFFSKYHGNFK